MKVCVDAGHGGSDSGAVGSQPFELLEKDFTLDLALNLFVLARWRWSTLCRWLHFAINSLYLIWLWRLVTGPSPLSVIVTPCAMS